MRADETIAEHGGALDAYLPQSFDPFQSIDTQLTFLVGMLPHQGEPIILPAVETRDDRWADVHIASDGTSTFVLLLDATKQVQSHRLLQQKVNDLAILVDKQERIERRLRMEHQSAAEMQQALAPASSVTVAGASFAWAVQPSHPISGDLTEVFRLDSDHVGLYLLDVAGRGTAAANRGVAVSKVLSDRAKGHMLQGGEGPQEGKFADPVNLVKKLGLMFPVHRETGQFFCLFYGILNPSTRQFTFASAGTRGFVYLPKNGEPTLNQSPGYPLGATTKPDYEEHAMQLNAGDRIIIFSDGVVDGLSPTNERYTVQRLIKSVADTRTVELRQAVTTIGRVANEWTDDKPHGDISVLAFELDS